MDAFLRQLPKVELHVHVEGTLEPELMFELAAPERRSTAVRRRSRRSGAPTSSPTSSPSSTSTTIGAGVLVTERDFHDLARAYLTRAAGQTVRHVEIFFDPQTHTDRGVPFETVSTGLRPGAGRGASASSASRRS